MKKVVSFLFLSLFATLLFSQSCLTEGIIFTRQSQLDSFHLAFPGCTSIAGNVKILETDSTIQNLSGLLGIDSISGDLYVQNCKTLVNLRGLDSLRWIGGGLLILTNSAWKLWMVLII
jgi:hypothetical protein